MERLKNTSRLLTFILLAVGFLVISRPFLVPFLFGLLIALIVYPICKKLENKKFPRGLAVLISVSLVLILFVAIVFVLILQLNSLNKDLPQLMEGMNLELAKVQNWIASDLGISILEQKNIFIDARKGLSDNLLGFISVAVMGIFNLIIIPIYSCLILYYRNTIVDFILSIVGEKYKSELPIIMNEAIHGYFNYVKGLFFVYIAVGILNSIGLFFLGIKYPLLFGMLTAFMTIIPYVGIITSALLPISITWIETGNIYLVLGIVAVFSFVQYLEAYLIFPYIVGKQLNINTLASIIIIIIGGFIWGVSGMLLFLPYMALLKIVSGKMEEMKPLRIFLEIPAKKK
jgi:predicted PurR-regulated permease PerM